MAANLIKIKTLWFDRAKSGTKIAPHFSLRTIGTPHFANLPRAALRVSRSLALSAIAFAMLAGYGSPSEAGERSGNDWPTYGSTDDNHYSPLSEINDGNASKLGLAWHYDIGVGPSSRSAPIEVNGILYVAAGQAVVHAFDAVSGKLLWQYDPEVWKFAGVKLRAAWGSRGLAYDNGKVFVGTVDGRLIAIDAKSGQPVWTAQTTEKDDGRYITGAPWVFDGKVAIGHGGADFGPVRGYVTTYDQMSGQQLWRFYTVPGDPKNGFESEAMRMAAKTWTGEWWKFGGGGTVWNAMAYDRKLGRLYIGTGNGSPWNRKIRSPGGGDNLFLCSIVALDAKTGKYLWHYQINPGEAWDYNADMDLALTDLAIGGKTQPVLITAPKNGFFYVLNRETGKLLSAEPIVPMNWASGIDLKTGRPVESPEARYPDGKVFEMWPGSLGAHSSQAMSFNRKTRIAYIPTNDASTIYTDPPGPLSEWRFPAGLQISPGLGAPPKMPMRRATSTLLAWDPVRQKPLWKLTLPGTPSFGGTAATGGNLVFAGDATGKFSAYDATTGNKLWSFDAQTSVLAQPITYIAGGRQFVSVVAGARAYSSALVPRVFDYRTQQWRLLTFALGGTDSLPPAKNSVQPVLDDPAFKVDAAQAARGASTFASRCSVCHGPEGRAAGTAPNLLTSSVPLDRTAFRTVVQQGALERHGMPKFSELTESELDSLLNYIRQRARSEMEVPST